MRTARSVAGSGSVCTPTARWRGGRRGSCAPATPVSPRSTTRCRSPRRTVSSARPRTANTSRSTCAARSRSSASARQPHGQGVRPPRGRLRRHPLAALLLDVDLTWTTDGIPYHYDLTTRYEIPCLVTGSVTVDGKTFNVDGQGQRDHSWGVRDWWTFGWCWCSVRLDDGTRVHLADIRMGIPDLEVFFGYIQTPGRAPGEALPATALSVNEEVGCTRLPVHGPHPYRRRTRSRHRARRDPRRLRSGAAAQRRRPHRAGSRGPWCPAGATTAGVERDGSSGTSRSPPPRSCRTRSGGRTAAASSDYFRRSPRILAPPMPAAAPSAPRWSSRSGRYSPMRPARIGIGIDCSQMRPGPVSTAKWCPSAPM